MNTHLVDSLVQAIQALTPEERSLLEEKLQAQKQHQEAPNSASSNPSELHPADHTPEDFIGMWRDRPEMQDSTQWVRTLRQQQWGNP